MQNVAALFITCHQDFFESLKYFLMAIILVECLCTIDVKKYHSHFLKKMVKLYFCL